MSLFATTVDLMIYYDVEYHCLPLQIAVWDAFCRTLSSPTWVYQIVIFIHYKPGIAVAILDL